MNKGLYSQYLGGGGPRGGATRAGGGTALGPAPAGPCGEWG